MAKETISFLNTIVDVCAQVGETLLYGLDVTGSGQAADVTLYEGLDIQSGRKINIFETDATFTTPFRWNPPLYLQRGLYIDVGTGVASCTVYFKPLVSPPKSTEAMVEP